MPQLQHFSRMKSLVTGFGALLTYQTQITLVATLSMAKSAQDSRPELVYPYPTECPGGPHLAYEQECSRLTS
ncbi:hypothetical protein EV356DRAFT_507138 [Viridothelium virens]|uniref:Uncharacterized protein n=1 Tax=Viridothelium virens TaxID=1048519 RepID=A0A6A6H1B3_VIRVR|nr:hypothetical protein EV356DRAFT_507138 [Viridothelium virens]